MGEIEAKVDGFAEAVETIVLAKEVHERHQAKEEVSDPISGSSGIRAQQRLVRESTGRNALGTVFSSSDLRGESISFQPVFAVGCRSTLMMSEYQRRDKSPHLHPGGRRRPQRIRGMMATISILDDADRDKNKKKKKDPYRDSAS